MMDSTSGLSLERNEVERKLERIMDQWTSLRQNLIKAEKLVLSRFCLHLQILALSLCPDYSTKEARELLRRDEMSMLQTFFEIEDGLNPESVDHAQAGHLVALAHGLFESSGGQQSDFWHQLDQQYTAFDNQSMCGLMVDVSGNNSLDEAHFEQLYHAILRSELLVGKKGVLKFDKFLEMVAKCNNVINPSLNGKV